MPRDFIVTPDSSRHIGGTITVPGDKSISHRAAIFSALAEGETAIHGFLDSEDCLNTLKAIKALGVEIRKSPVTCREPYYTVSGKGFCGLSASLHDIDCGNSGTGMRLLAGLLAVQPFESVLTGDESLCRRPMQRIMEPLERMGARIEANDGKPPLRIHPATGLRPLDYESPVASAQVKSAILLAGLAAGVPVSVTEPDVTRDHTERMLTAFGVPVERQGMTIRLEPVPRLDSPGAVDIPGDLSSAAFWLVLATTIPGAGIRLSGVGVNPTRNGVLRLLDRMGANISCNIRDGRGGEPIADIDAGHSRLKAIDIDAADVALAIDEIPAILIAAACADGTTRLRGAAELRVKESDRLVAMAAGLRALGIRVEEYPDGLDVTGGVLQGGEVDSHGDHRIAMAFAVAATVAQEPVRIRNTDNVATSYPAFRHDMAALGVDIKEIEGTT